MDDLDLTRGQGLASPAPGWAEPAFDIRTAEGAETPLVFASPHSGRYYPADLMAASLLGASAIRSSEDALVDRLLEGAEAFGAPVITARYARAYMDVNRDPYELDPAMFEDELPAFAKPVTVRVAAGLGSIARVVGEGQEIYSRKLAFAEARDRIEAVHRPYHRALRGLIGQAKAGFGRAVLIDWHSMPSAAARAGRRGRSPDMVLGDRFGAACSPGLTTLVERELKAMGYEVARNAPYAGGYTTEAYGEPREGVHALQLEINRSLYLDEANMAPGFGFTPLRQDLHRLWRILSERWREAL